MIHRLLGVLLLVVMASPVVALDPPGPAVKLTDVQLDKTKLRVHFIDIGPGLAVLVQTPDDRRTVFIDGGKWGTDDMLRYVEHFVPAGKVGDTATPNAKPIDLAIVTHADLDHYAGMKKVFAAYDVREFWHSGYSSSKVETNSTWKPFLATTETEEDCVLRNPLKDTKPLGTVHLIDDGGTDSNKTDDVTLILLNVDSDPPEVGPVFGRHFNEAERRNNASLVFKITFKSTTFLITGDINGRDKDHEDASTEREIDSEELELLTRHTFGDERFKLQSTVLQAPHHGSNGSCSLPFLEAVKPTWVVIPAGHQFDHPTEETLDRIMKVVADEDHILRTDEGDSTPEKSSPRDERGDDNYVFEVDGTGITKIHRVTVHD